MKRPLFFKQILLIIGPADCATLKWSTNLLIIEVFKESKSSLQQTLNANMKMSLFKYEIDLYLHLQCKYTLPI